VTSLKKALDNTETVFRRKELELLRDLDIAQEKNDVSIYVFFLYIYVFITITGSIPLLVDY